MSELHENEKFIPPVLKRILIEVELTVSQVWLSSGRNLPLVDFAVSQNKNDFAN